MNTSVGVRTFLGKGKYEVVEQGIVDAQPIDVYKQLWNTHSLYQFKSLVHPSFHLNGGQNTGVILSEINTDATSSLDEVLQSPKIQRHEFVDWIKNNSMGDTAFLYSNLLEQALRLDCVDQAKEIMSVHGFDNFNQEVFDKWNSDRYVSQNIANMVIESMRK